MSLLAAIREGSTTQRSLAYCTQRRSARCESTNSNSELRLKNFIGTRSTTMSQRIVIIRDYLRRLRNDILMANLFRRMRWPHNRVDKKLVFVCPLGSESHLTIIEYSATDRSQKAITRNHRIDELGDVAFLNFLSRALCSRITVRCG